MGGLAPNGLASVDRPRLPLLVGVKGGVFLGILDDPLGVFVGDPFCVDSSTPESPSVSTKERQA